MLEYHRGLASQIPHLFFIIVLRIDLRVADDNRAGLRRLQPVERAKQRRLARTGRADHRDDLTLADIQIDAVQHLLFPEGFG